MSVLDKIAEESEELRISVLEKMKTKPPNEVSIIFDSYSPYFEDIIFEKWREDKRFDELIEFVLAKYEYSGGELVWSQLLIDLKLNHQEKKAVELLQSLIAGRSEFFWSAVNKRKKGVTNIYTEIAIAEKKGTLAKVLYEYLYILENKEKNLQDKKAIEKTHNQIFEVLNEERKLLPTALNTNINEKQFWILIDNCKKNAITASTFLNSLRNSLEQLKGKEILKFNNLVTDKINQLNNYELWAMAYLILGGCSDDMFDYFKMWIICQGKELYQAALEGAEPFVNVVIPKWEFQCDELLSIIDDAYFSRENKHLKSIKLIHFDTDIPWSENTIERIFSKELLILKRRNII